MNRKIREGVSFFCAIILIFTTTAFAQNVKFRVQNGITVGYKEPVQLLSSALVEATHPPLQETLIPVSEAQNALSVSSGFALFPEENGVPIVLDSCKITELLFSVYYCEPNKPQKVWENTAALPLSYFTQETDPYNAAVFTTKSCKSTVPTSPSVLPQSTSFKVTPIQEVGAIFHTKATYQIGDNVRFGMRTKPSGHSYKFVFRIRLEAKYKGITQQFEIGSKDLWTSFMFADKDMFPVISPPTLTRTETGYQTIIKGTGTFLPYFRLQTATALDGTWNTIPYNENFKLETDGGTWTLVHDAVPSGFFRLAFAGGNTQYTR